MKLYSGIDLHSSNSYLAIVDATGKRVFKEKSPNDMATILRALEPYRKRLAGIVVESTYNWYWLVDGLMAEGYTVHLANPSAIAEIYRPQACRRQARRLLVGRDAEDWTSCRTGYIYPKNERPIRDLLRKRGHLVSLRIVLNDQSSEHYHQELRHENEYQRHKAPARKPCPPLLADNEDLALAGQVSKDPSTF